ncbi:MAG: hypothetical protein P8X39_04900 [Desulfofustis sp.]|jgi:hypothetical protein
MYTARTVLKLWGKSSEADQRRLKMKYFSGLSAREFEDDFVSFLAQEFNLKSDEQLPNAGQETIK